jgi:hypothetical protein
MPPKATDHNRYQQIIRPGLRMGAGLKIFGVGGSIPSRPTISHSLVSGTRFRKSVN